MAMNKQNGSGTIIGIIVILTILIVGAVYVWKSQDPALPDDDAIENQVSSDEELDSREATLQSQSDSDELGSIESDLQATSFESL